MAVGLVTMGSGAGWLVGSKNAGLGVKEKGREAGTAAGAGVSTARNLRNRNINISSQVSQLASKRYVNTVSYSASYIKLSSHLSLRFIFTAGVAGSGVPRKTVIGEAVARRWGVGVGVGDGSGVVSTTGGLGALKEKEEAAAGVSVRGLEAKEKPAEVPEAGAALKAV